MNNLASGAAHPSTANAPDLDAALAGAGDGAFVVGADGRLRYWNRAAERILGYSARDVIGRLCCDIFAGVDDRGNRLCYQGCHVMTLVKRGDAVQNFDMRTRAKSGRPLWLNFSILSVAGDEDQGSVTVHLFRDVTATKELLTLVHEKLAAADAAPPAQTLTRREIEILRLLAAGAGTRAMAERLHVSTATIRNHVQNITSKLGVHSRLEAVVYATRHRLL
jgi:PAS domain S-box-containing protein